MSYSHLNSEERRVIFHCFMYGISDEQIYQWIYADSRDRGPLHQYLRRRHKHRRRRHRLGRVRSRIIGRVDSWIPLQSAPHTEAGLPHAEFGKDNQEGHER